MTLLVEAPTGRHFAQFHREADTLTEAAFMFVEAGLRRGDSVLLIAGRERLDQLHARLAATRFHPATLTSSGQLVVLDPVPLMEQFAGVGNDEPEWTGLLDRLAPTLSRVQPYGHGLRIYTELANALWEAGDTNAAVRLEDFWNALGDTHAFSLYCGFRMDTHSERAYAGPLEELGRTHSDILATPDDELFGQALDRASREIFGISLTQMAGVWRQDGSRRFPSGQRAMLWVTRNLPMSRAQLADRARQYFQDGRA